MKNSDSRLWLAGLGALILVLTVALVATETAYAEARAGLLVVFLLGIGVVALLLVIAAAWPGFCLRAGAHLVRSPGKALFVGLVNYVFLGAIALVLANLGPAAVIGLGLVGVLAVGTLLGLPAVAEVVGGGLYALRAQEALRWSKLVAGIASLYLAVLVPVVGWFLVLPAVCLWSFGATVLALLTRGAVPPAETEQP